MVENSKDRAAAQFAKTQKDGGKKNMTAYEAEAAAVRAKTARLRELRLAQEAAAPAAPAKPTAKKKAGAKEPNKRPAKSTRTLADWMKVERASGRNG